MWLLQRKSRNNTNGSTSIPQVKKIFPGSPTVSNCKIMFVNPFIEDEIPDGSKWKDNKLIGHKYHGDITKTL